MDARFMEDSNNTRTEENLASQYSKAVHALRPIELGDTGDKQGSGECHHFSIRGYVSQVRKTNRETCWPFHVIDNHYKLEEHADLLPPMVVTEFRWWGCRSCLHRSHIIGVGLEDGTATHSHSSENRRLKIDGTSFHGNPVVEAHACPPSSRSNLQIASGEKILGDGSVEADSFINVKDCHLQPSVCFHEKDKGSIDAGMHYHVVHFGLSEANQNPLSETPHCGGINCKNLGKEKTVATEIIEAVVAIETHKTRGVISDHGTANMSGNTANISQGVLQSEKTVLQGGNAHNVKTTELEETKLGFKVSDAESNSRILALIADTACVLGPKEDQCLRKSDMFETKEVLQGANSSVPKTNKCNINGLEGSIHKESKCDRDSVKSQDDSQSSPRQEEALNVYLHRRKARKVRMLDDIIKSEVLGLSRQSHLSGGNDAIQCGDECKMDSAVCKGGLSAAKYNLNVVSEEKERESFISKKRKVFPESEDEGPSLIHWLRRVPKKVKTQKCDEGHKPADNAVVTSLSGAYASPEKSLHTRVGMGGAVLDIGGKTFEGEMPMNITYVDAVRPHVRLRQAMNDSNHAVVEGETAKCMNVGKALPKLANDDHILCAHREQPDDSYNGIVMRIKQDTKYEVEDGVSSPIHGLKDSSGTFEYETLNAYQNSQQISKKRSFRGKKGSAEEGTENVPVIREVAAVGSIQIRGKQGSVPFTEKQAAAPIRKEMTASSLREKQADPSVTEKQAVVDGIPIEILELLQSNYHKNHQLNSGRSTARVIEPSEANKKVRDGRLDKLSNVTDSNPGALPYSQHKNKSGVHSELDNTGNSACAIGKQTGSFNQEPRVQTSHSSGIRRRQIKGKGLGPATFRESSDAHLCLAPPMSGTQPPNTEPIGRHCSQNFGWNRIMLQNAEPRYNALAISRQRPCKCVPCGAVQINNSHKIHPGIYNSSLLPQTTPLENNLSKVTLQSGGLKLVDSSLSHVHRIKQKVDVKNKRTLSAGSVYAEAGKTGKECCSKVSQPLNLYTNDSIPAMHLLRLMDPAVGSVAAPLCPTVSSEQADFLGKFKHCENHYQKDFVGVDRDMRTKYSFNCLGISEHQVYNQTNSSNLMPLVPRYSAPDAFSQKRILSGPNNFNALYEFKGKKPSEVALSLKTGRKEKRKSSHLAIQSRVSEQRPLPRERHSQDRLQLILNYASCSKLSEAREGVIQVEYRNKEEAKLPASGSCQTELCVVNRNPADFSIPDENNVYMISYEDLKPRYVPRNRNKQCAVRPDVPRQQRLLKLLLQSGI